MRLVISAQFCKMSFFACTGSGMVIEFSASANTTMNTPHEDYELTFERREGYLYALVRANRMDHSTALSYLSNLWAEAARFRIKNILLERDVRVTMSPEEAEKTFTDLGTSGAGVRVAFVNTSLPPEAGLEHFIELNIRTGADYRFFDTIGEAEAWLRDGRSV